MKHKQFSRVFWKLTTIWTTNNYCCQHYDYCQIVTIMIRGEAERCESKVQVWRWIRNGANNTDETPSNRQKNQKSVLDMWLKQDYAPWFTRASQNFCLSTNWLIVIHIDNDVIIPCPISDTMHTNLGVLDLKICL